MKSTVKEKRKIICNENNVKNDCNIEKISNIHNELKAVTSAIKTLVSLSDF